MKQAHSSFYHVSDLSDIGGLGQSGISGVDLNYLGSTSSIAIGAGVGLTSSGRAT